MPRFIRLLISLMLVLLVVCAVLSQEGKSKTKPTGVLTLLGTIKGEVDKVSDGGRKIEVKYKELVATTGRSPSTSFMTRGSTSAKFRPPLPKEFILREKSQELELRLYDTSIVRVLNAKETAEDEKASDKKKETTEDKMEGGSEEKGDTKEKSKSKPPAKTDKKSAELALPGKPGDYGSLVKGQYVLVTVYREDLPGYSRLYASHLYILGEK